MQPPWYDPPAVFRTQRLALGDGHTMQVQHAGRPCAAGGLPVLLLHGGPGSGQSALLWRTLDPQRYHLVAPDQRGCGGSTPRGATAHNTLAQLLADLRLLHRQLCAEHGQPLRWLVVGGSWGATLAIAHAADFPQAVSGLLLRASFLARDADVQAFLAPPAAAADPESAERCARWRALCDAAADTATDTASRTATDTATGTASGTPSGARSGTEPGTKPDLVHGDADLLPGLARALQSHAPAARQQAAARAWWRWEQALDGGPAQADAPHAKRLAAPQTPVDAALSTTVSAALAADLDGDALARQIDRLRVQTHYLLHGCWLRDDSLLQRAARLSPIPIWQLHGTHDRICPPAAAAQLAQVLARAAPGAALQWVNGAGHSPAHPAMAAAQRDALDHWARHGRWPAAETSAETSAESSAESPAETRDDARDDSPSPAQAAPGVSA